MAYFLAPIANDQQCDSNGAPLSGGFIYTYLAGSSSAYPTYTDNTGVTPQANPIVLNTLGLPPSPVWLQSGAAYKYIIRDSLGVLQRTIDNVSGINDATVSVSQWVTFGAAPTYISATSFSVAGDQTGTFQVGRRVQCTVTAGTVYGTITASVFGIVTTVTVTMDSGALDSGLSVVSVGLLTPLNPSVPGTYVPYAGATGVLDLSGTVLKGAAPLAFDGATVGGAKTTVSVVDPTANRTITVPDADVDLTKVRAASTTLDGVARVATGTEAQAGSSGTTIITPAGLNVTVIGMGQSYQDVTASRASGVTYTNSTGRTIFISVWGTTTATVSMRAQGYVAGVNIEDNQWYSNGGGSTCSDSIRLVVPPGATYSVTLTNVTLAKWFELR